MLYRRLGDEGKAQVRLNVTIELRIVDLMAVKIEAMQFEARTGQEVKKLNVLCLGLTDVLRSYRCGHRISLNP